MGKEDYTLHGQPAQAAETNFLAAADWYHTEIPRAQMKALMQRSDGPAIRNTLLYYGLMILFAGIGIALWPSWWSLPFWLAYGTLYGSGADARWHEMGHKTAFKTPWMNDVVYQIACFMMIRNPVTWRWSHARHHAETIIVGRDPEIAMMRPPDLMRVVLNVFGVIDTWNSLGRMLLHASGRIHPEEATYIPKWQHTKAIRIARIWTATYTAVIMLALVMGSILPLMVIGLPRMYGAWHHIMTGVLQHAGLAENVADHRLNTRTVYMNPISRFIYLNMNYHVEHHMFTMVPYHRLPELHDLIKHDLPAPNPSIWHAYKELLPVLIKQLSYKDAILDRKLPEGARPYRGELHTT